MNRKDSRGEVASSHGLCLHTEETVVLADACKKKFFEKKFIIKCLQKKQLTKKLVRKINKQGVGREEEKMET